VVLVESAKEALAAIRRNLTTLALPGVSVVAAPVERYLNAGVRTGVVDLVLLDPPYAQTQDELGAVLTALVDLGWLTGGAVVLVERSRRSGEPAWPPALQRHDERRYGETTVWWAQHC
jgi:16S rRNA (guanine966-N2)-methyltransferase